MVLPSPAPAAAPAQGVERWIEEIRAGLRLSPAGVLILVDSAVPEQLGPLVRSLLLDHPALDVLVDVRQLDSLPDGSTLVLAPPASAAAWLNDHRPLFARKALKVVLWCDHATSTALAHEAPDFFDWIAQRQECPPRVAEHAVWGLRKALCARARGVLFLCDPPDEERLERAFHAAFPGRKLHWLEPEQTPYSTLVNQIRAAGRAWVACRAFTRDASERFRWALAEARRRTRAVLVVPQGGEDCFWHVTDHVWSLQEAIKLLAEAGAEHPGRLAAASGLETDAVFGLLDLVARGYDEGSLLRAMLQCPDAGAGLGERMLSAGIAGLALQGSLMPAPVQRALGKYVGLRRGSRARPRREVKGWASYDGPVWPFLRARARRIEYLLSTAERTPELWQDLARLALEHGDAGAAIVWATRSLALRESAGARRLYGVACAELGLLNLDHGLPVGAPLIDEAIRALDEAAATLEPGSPPEDALGLHALRAYLVARTGRASEANDALASALRLVETPEARARDVIHLARALLLQGHPARAEEILRASLSRSPTEEESLEVLILLGGCALTLGRPMEAEAISGTVLEKLRHADGGRDAKLRIEAEQLHIAALLARDESTKALAFADAAVRAAVPWWESTSPLSRWISPQAVARLPLFSRVLRRVGRLADAEALLRKLLGLPLPDDTASIGAGLESQPVLQAFLRLPPGPSQPPPGMRPLLVAELARTLRAQGRHHEADGLLPSPPISPEP